MKTGSVKSIKFTGSQVKPPAYIALSLLDVFVPLVGLAERVIDIIQRLHVELADVVIPIAVGVGVEVGRRVSMAFGENRTFVRERSDIPLADFDLHRVALQLPIEFLVLLELFPFADEPRSLASKSAAATD